MVSWILAAAMIGGLAMRALGLPPLVGFLIAGFILRALGVPLEHWLEELAHAGVLLLLFSVGLKLRLKNLARAEVIGSGALHLLLFAMVLALLLFIFAGVGGEAAMLLACGFSFSSTVVAAKLLEDRRELRAFHGRVAVGVLVIQDLVAVGLLASLGAASPSWWALALVVFFFGAKWLRQLIDWSGHGELLVLAGLTLTLAIGGGLFASAGLSSELGALLIGALVGSHPRSGELSYRIWSLKEVLLAGFFISVGMSATPTFSALLTALAFVALIPVKGFLFFMLMVRFRLRARSSFLAAAALASYSEFGLIVAKPMAEAGYITEHWLSVMGLSGALSFIVAAQLNRHAHSLFERWHDVLIKFERQQRHPDDRPISLGSAEVLVFGMGRVGTGAYEYLKSQNARVVGLDSDPGKVQRHLGEGRRVVYADAEDPDLWQRLRLDGVRAVLLALPDVESKQFSVTNLRRSGYQGFISATNVFEHEAHSITDAGGDATYNYFDDAGKGFAKMTWDALYHPERSA